MTTLPNQSFASSYSAKALCQIVGLACLAGFLVDIATILFPANFTAVEWRVGFIQQLSDRSVILLFGLSLFLYGIIDLRVWRKRLAMTCLIIGMVFCLSSILVIRDSWQLREQATQNITAQAAQVQSQIDKTKENPKAVNPKLTLEQLDQASKVLGTRAETMKQNAVSSLFKTGFSTVGNLVVIGLALIGLGRYGLRPPRM